MDDVDDNLGRFYGGCKTGSSNIHISYFATRKVEAMSYNRDLGFSWGISPCFLEKRGRERKREEKVGGGDEDKDTPMHA